MLFLKISQYSQENTCVGDSSCRLACLFSIPILKNISQRLPLVNVLNVIKPCLLCFSELSILRKKVVVPLEVFYKKAVLKNFAIFTGKALH